MVRSRHSRATAVDAQSSEIRRLLVFAGVGMGVTLIALTVFGSDSEPTPDWTGGRSVRGDEVAEVTANVIPWDPPTKELNEGLSEGDRGRLEPDKAAIINLLAVKAANRPHVHFRDDPAFRDVGGYERVDPVEIAKPENADTYRARPVEFIGMLIDQKWANPRDYELDPGTFDPSRPILEGRLKTDAGVVIKFLVVQFGTKMEPLILNTRHKVMGVFYRLVDGGDGSIHPFILATKATPALPLKLVDELSPDLATRIEKIEDLELGRKPQTEPEFLELVGYVLKNGRKAIPEGVEPELLRGREPQDEPGLFRLKPVRVKGILVYLNRESFEYEDMREGDAPILGYWHAIVSDQNPDENVPQSVLFPFDSLPAELEQWAYARPNERKARPHIDVTGIYYRLHSYMARPDKHRRRKEVHLPVVVAVEQPIVTEGTGSKPTDTGGFLALFIGVGSGLALVLVLMLARDRRNAARLEEHIRETRLKRRKSQGMDLNRPLEPPSGDSGSDSE